MTNQTEEGGMNPLRTLDALQRDTSTLAALWHGTTLHPLAEQCAYLTRRARQYLPAALATMAAARPDGWPTTTPGSGNTGGGSGGVHSIVETAIINAERANSPTARYRATITALNEATKTVALLMAVDPLDDIAPVEELFKDLRGWLDCAWEAAAIRLQLCAGSVNGCRSNADPTTAPLCGTCAATAQAARDANQRARKAQRTRQNRRTNRKAAA